jgi:plastocyanin
MRVAPPLAALALVLAAAPPPARPADAGGTVTGKVDVQPARFQDETVVYLKGVPGKRAPRTLAMDQRGMKFLPLVLPVVAGDTVDFLNNDGVDHNVFSPDGDAFNLGTFRAGDKRSHVFDEPGAYRIRCSIHPEMLGWVFVSDSAFAVAVDRKGRFTLKDVPPGTYQLAAWNPSVEGPERTVTVAAGKTVEENLALKQPRR